MQRIGREQHALHAKIVDQVLSGGNLVGRGRDLLVSEDQPGVFARIRSFALNILRANGITNVSEAVFINTLSLDRLLAYGPA